MALVKTKISVLAVVLLSAAVLVPVVGTAIWRARDQGGIPRHVREAIAAQPGPVVEMPAIQGGELPTAAAVGARTAQVVRQRLAGRGLTKADAEAIGAVVGRTVEALFVGDRDDFARALEAQGIPADRLAVQDGPWDARTSLVRGAPVHLDGIDAVLRLRDGEVADEPVSVPGTRRSSISMSRPRGDDDVNDPVSARTDVVEILIPARLQPAMGEPFTGRFGLLVAKRPADGQWIVIGYESRDVPQDRIVALPPL